MYLLVEEKIIYDEDYEEITKTRIKKFESLEEAKNKLVSSAKRVLNKPGIKQYFSQFCFLDFLKELNIKYEDLEINFGEETEFVYKNKKALIRKKETKELDKYVLEAIDNHLYRFRNQGVYWDNLIIEYKYGKDDGEIIFKDNHGALYDYITLLNIINIFPNNPLKNKKLSSDDGLIHISFNESKLSIRPTYEGIDNGICGYLKTNLFGKPCLKKEKKYYFKYNNCFDEEDEEFEYSGYITEVNE